MVTIALDRAWVGDDQLEVGLHLHCASVSGTEQGPTIERLAATGGFDSVQATWNLLERSAGDALEAAVDLVQDSDRRLCCRTGSV